MYQLSQALAAGKVQLMDWNSVVNAGMGGEVFQNALKRTAKNMGTDVDALIKKYGSFRESLTQGEWLTADVLTETLTQLSGAYTEADLLAKGYTKEQAAEILDLAQTAEDAATKVKTFTQLWDTLKESAQSGWTQTWEILIGDFEEAKELLTKVSEVIGKMIGDSAEQRNELLQGWKDEGGRAGLIDSLANAFEGLMNIVTPIKEAFREIFPPMTVEQLISFTKHLKSLTGRFKNFTEDHAPQIKSAFKGIFSIVDIGVTFFKKLAGGIVDLFGRFSGLGGGILEAAGSIGEWLGGLRDTVKETDIFGIAIDKVVGFLGKIIDKLRGFGGSIKSAFQAPGVQGFLDIMSSIWDVITKIGSKLGEIFAPLGQAVSNVFNNASFSDILNDGIFAAILVGVHQFVGGRQLAPFGGDVFMFNATAPEQEYSISGLGRHP
jgi:tape measure domain-containing protein